MNDDVIRLTGVRTHNLKNFDLTLPRGKIIVLTGVSGSGKSSLAFDTLYAEGQRRYVESLSAYARQFLERMEKPDVESITGILPAIAIEAKNIITNARSTVGTQTEINDYLRVLFARIGKTFCEKCGRAVELDRPRKVAEEVLERFEKSEVLVLFPLSLKGTAKNYLREWTAELVKQGFTRILAEGKVRDLADFSLRDASEGRIEVVVDRLEAVAENRSRLVDSIETAYRYGGGQARVRAGEALLKFSEHFHCAHCDLPYKLPTPNMFSFNSPLGACPECQGFGRIIAIDRNLVVPDERKTLKGGAIEPWGKPGYSWFFEQLLEYCRRAKISVDCPYQDLHPSDKKRIWEGDPKDAEFESLGNFFKYLEKKTYKMHVRIFLSRYRGYFRCPVCGGSRLKSEALLVKIGGKNIYELLGMSVKDLRIFFDALEITPHEEEAAGPVLAELRKRLSFLDEVGLGYVTLDRNSRTLSGGEAQRINLTAALSASLVDTLYVLDEPSIGLHERDNGLLIRILRRLRDLGNTVIVVEHDRQMIEMADRIIDLGPFAGENGGEIVFRGEYRELLSSETLTGKYLSNRMKIPGGKDFSGETDSKRIRVRGAAEHNLKNIDVEIPLQRLVVLTGVSGSGKSTLLYDVLYKNYLRHRGRPVQDLGKVRSVSGWNAIDDIMLVDQAPIGRTPRSNPVTYVQAFDRIRKLFASTEPARRQGIRAGDFSFNVRGGRCEECEGSGKLKVEMHFLADIYVDCEKCGGTRYQKKILGIRYRGKSIHEVLKMTCGEACAFFSDQEEILGKLQILRRIGLGYLRLGQSALTLSQGEAQRMKLALEMTRQGRGGNTGRENGDERILYLFDEPTTGLHYDDIRFMMEAFRELLERGHSVMVIEHNMEVIRHSDYVIDLGPEGGDEGGQVVFEGPLREMLGNEIPGSHTARCLKEYMKKVEGAGGSCKTGAGGL